MKIKCSNCGDYRDISEFYPAKTGKYGVRGECKCCKKEKLKLFIINNPWYKIFHNIKNRCTKPNNKDYRYYGGKGIKCLLTQVQIKELWFRDKAYEMKKPSIDRRDSNKDYCYNNCRFIEKSLNSKNAMYIRYHTHGLNKQAKLNLSYKDLLKLSSANINLKVNLQKVVKQNKELSCQKKEIIDTK